MRYITRVAHFMRFAGGFASIPLASWRRKNAEKLAV
jgi:hypothetical protein